MKCAQITKYKYPFLNYIIHIQNTFHFHVYHVLANVLTVHSAINISKLHTENE